ncbi:putative transcription factor At1g11510 [Tasmannia lanceolata]|uniref:putative transcription factor At1g11510 n=1 Tax=Tasmannia lanceolata TaxID=3420 RepID=UPI00406460A0
MKKSIPFEFTQRKLYDKIRKTNTKYETLRDANKGEDPFFATPHDQKVYKLWKIIWGAEKDDNGQGNVSRENIAPLLRPKKDVSMPSKSSPSIAIMPHEYLYLRLTKIMDMSRLDESQIKQGLNLIEDSKLKEWEDQWKEFDMMNMQVYTKQLKLVSDQANLICEALKVKPPLSKLF